MPRFALTFSFSVVVLGEVVGGRKHYIFAFSRSIFPLLFGRKYFEVDCLHEVKIDEFLGMDLRVCVAELEELSVDGLIFHFKIGLGGDVVAEVGPDDVVVVDLIDDFACFFHGLDDKLDLILKVLGLADLYLQQVVLQDLLALLRILPDLFLQLDQPQVRIDETIQVGLVALQICDLQSHFLSFLL